MPMSFIAKAAALGALAAAPAHSVAVTAPPPAKAAPATARPSASASSRTDLVRGLNESFKKIDTNNDGNASSAELNAFAARMRDARANAYVRQQDESFAKFDTNKDGQISKDEFRRATAKPEPAPVDSAALVAKLDRNGDHMINSSEYGAVILANFDRLDSNHDGILSDKERSPQPK